MLSKAADIYVSRVKKKRWFKKDRNVVIISTDKEKHRLRLALANKSKWKVGQWKKDGKVVGHTLIKRTKGPEEDKKFIQQLHKKFKTKPKSQMSKAAGIMDKIHLGLDVAGMTPGVGAAADLINAGAYALRGQKANAALSLTAAIPGVGQAATAAKLTNKAIKAKKAVTTAQKAKTFQKGMVQASKKPKEWAKELGAAGVGVGYGVHQGLKGTQ